MRANSRALLLLLLLFSLSFAAYRWSAQTGGPITAAPLVHSESGSVIAGSQDGWIYSFSQQDGRLLWKYEVGGPVYAKPVLFAGSVAVAGGDTVATLDARTGTEGWRADVGRVDGLAASSDTLFVTTGQGVFALGLSGERKWHVGYNATHTAPGIGGGLLLVGRGDEVIALDAESGEQKWKTKLGGFVSESSPAYFENRVFVGANDGNLYVLLAGDGSVRQRFRADGWVQTTPAFSGGIVVIGSSAGTVYGISIVAGEESWKHRLPEAAKGTVAMLDLGTRTIALVPSMDGKLYGFDAEEGKLLWAFPSAGAAGSPASSRSEIYFGSHDSSLYSITPSPFCTILSPQDSTLVNEAEVIIRGLAFSSSGLANLQVRVNGGPWQALEPSSEWEYELDPTQYEEGRILVECRSSDTAMAEAGRFSSVALVRSQSAPLPELWAEVPQEIEAGKPFFVNVTSQDGRPLSGVTVLAGGQSFSGSGSVEAKIGQPGWAKIAVNRKGYAPKDIDVNVRGSDSSLLILAGALAIFALAILLILRMRKRPPQPI